jgi:hypothetical protein
VKRREKKEKNPYEALYCLEGKKVGIKSSEFWKRANTKHALTYHHIQLIPKLFVPEEIL